MTEKYAIEILNNEKPSCGEKIIYPEGERCEAYGMAIEALEKQMLKKPIEYEDKYYACPTCGNVLMHKWEKYPTVLADRKNGLPCCLSCLQAIDWSES